MYRHILVPLALDTHDRDPAPAFAVARALAAPGARITILHVIEAPPPFAIRYMPEGYAEELRDAIEAQLDVYAQGLPEAEGVVAEGHAARSIIDWAEENDADCIIIAPHRGSLGGFRIGSTAAQVLRHADCAVHLLR